MYTVLYCKLDQQRYFSAALKAQTWPENEHNINSLAQTD